MTLLKKVIKFHLFTNFLSFVALQGPPRNDFDRKFPYGSTFKSVTCENFDANNYMFLRNCSVKAYSRNFSGLNVGYTLHRPMNRPIFLKIVTMFRYGNIYRDIRRTTVEICSILDNLDKQPVFKNFIGAIATQIGNLMHKCPYSGSYDVKNLTIDDNEHKHKFLNPEGFFKICLTLLKPADKPHARLCAVFYVKSPMKESYGK
ncbi:unnamed protein product [Chironomus riparius]|uniref:Uncharacterized protein n=1 Tax=Chironomus riparius TaxID=315576 RepID=A0A9N9S9B2_9DIPT|nr:unnamed protein product [Chironomus riparius]